MEELSSKQIFYHVVEEMASSLEKAKLVDKNLFDYENKFDYVKNLLCTNHDIINDMSKFMLKNIQEPYFNFRGYFFLYIYEELGLIDFYEKVRSRINKVATKKLFICNLEDQKHIKNLLVEEIDNTLDLLGFWDYIINNYICKDYYKQKNDYEYSKLMLNLYGRRNEF